MHDITADSPRASRSARWLSTLSGRLVIALVAFVLVATAGVLAVELARGRRQLLAQSRAALAGRARLVADRLGRSVRERQSILAVWPQLESSQDLAVDDIDKRLAASLRQLAANFGESTLAFGLDTDGRVVAASDARLIGQRIDDPAWRPESGVATRLAPRPAVFGTPPADRILVVVAPVTDRASGRPLGRLVLTTSWLEMIRAAAAAIGDEVHVQDASGGNYEVESAAADSAEEGSPARGPDTPAENGGERLRGEPIPLRLSGVTGSVTDAIPLAQALAPLHETERRLLLLALVVLAITLPAAAVVAGSTTRALDRLTRSALAVRHTAEQEARGRQPVAEAAGPSDASAFEDVPAGAPREVHVLAGALKAMLERLERSRHELARQESLASVGSMAAVLAHEIRTPLAVLRGSADMLAKKVAGDAKGEELVSLLQEETDRLSRLARDLLVFARPRPPERSAIDLADVARRAAGMLGDRFRRASVELELATSPAPVRADSEQLGQAALNVLNNALEFSPLGSTVRLETGVDAEGAYLRVADEGPGVPPESLERIWLPFVTTRRGGTGLGLPIVRKILEAHGGRARIDSQPGAGARVTLTLPREGP